MKAFTFVKVADDLEQVAGLWVTLGAEHAHEALGRLVSEISKSLKTDCGIDVVAQDRFSGVHVAANAILVSAYIAVITTPIRRIAGRLTDSQ